MNRPASFEELVSLYGHPKDFGLNESTKSQWEQKYMTLWTSNKFMGRNIPLLWPIEIPFTKIYCNKDLVPILDKFFFLLITRGLIHEIKSLDGCWNIRMIRGSLDKWSIHSFALALDFNAAEMPLGSPSKWSPEFVQTIKEIGFIFGGDFKRLDPQHIQFASGC